MKKFLALLLSLTFCGAFFVGCKDNEEASSSSSSSSTSGPFESVPKPENPDPEVVTYEVKYYAVIDGGTPTTVPEEMKATEGKYPTSYVYGVGAVVSDLQDTQTYDFQGWYIDSACTTAFSSPISVTSATDQTLYAKIVTESQTPDTPTPTPIVKTISYKVMVNGEAQTDTTVFDLLKGNGEFPVEYTVGTGVAIPDLQDVNEYDFMGWYVNEACDNAFGGTIGENENGDVTLYAKVQTKAKITYLAVVDGKVQAFANLDTFKKEDGNYPESYVYNTETKIDDLKTQVSNYQFGGWYLDEECEIEFDGTVDANRRGELKLYADFIDLNNNKYWTPNF